MSRVALWLMIPLNLLVCLWVWIGRLAFGVAGWFLLLLIPMVLVLMVMLVVTTALALTQDGSPKALTGVQTASRIGLWISLLVLGAVMPDFGDTDDSRRSALTQLLGYSDGLYDASLALALLAGSASLALWLVLLLSLTAGRRKLTP